MTRTFVSLNAAAAVLIFAAHPVTSFADTLRILPGAKRVLQGGTADLPFKSLPGTGGARANDPKDLPCPADLIAVIYDEDANGNRIPGTEEYFCVWE